MSQDGDPRPLVAHVLHAFDVGGLENGVVNLLNRLPRESHRHVVIALAGITDFRKRVVRDDVQFIALDKRPGHTFKLYPRLYRLFRELKPAIVHTRNLAALEAVVPAWAAGVPVRLHGEHGRDVGDLDGSSRKYQWIRRLYAPFVGHYVALSRDLERYLVDAVGIAPRRVTQLYNGVDAARFAPASEPRVRVADCPFQDPALWLVGSVGRMQAVKDPLNLVRAFLAALAARPQLRATLRLVMIGGGPLQAEAQTLLDRSGASALAWLPGERRDIPELLRSLDCFVLPSLAEGISNTLLEAMATGLPVVATDVGGNRELVEPGVTGELVPAADPRALASCIVAYAEAPDRARAAGQAGRARALRAFTLDEMVSRYGELYDSLLPARRGEHGTLAALRGRRPADAAAHVPPAVH